MKNTTIVAFLFGAVAGAAGTYFLMTRKNEEIIPAEPVEEETKEEKVEVEPELPEKEDIPETTVQDKASIARANLEKRNIFDYGKFYENKNESETEETVVEEVKIETPDIYEIYIDEYDSEEPDFVKLSYNLYADGTLADDYHQIIEDVDSKIGIDRLKDFQGYSDEYELYIRNNTLRADYEILKDERTYFEVTGLEGKPLFNET